MLICELFKMGMINEAAEEMADIVTARGLLNDKNEYDKFIEYITKKHDKAYADNVASQAKMLARSVTKPSSGK